MSLCWCSVIPFYVLNICQKHIFDSNPSLFSLRKAESLSDAVCCAHRFPTNKIKPFGKQIYTYRNEWTHLMHVGIYKDFKGPHSQGDVGRCSGNGEDIVKGLLPHIVGIDGLHQIATGNRHHGSIHSELQLPCTELWVGVYTGEPESGGGNNLISFEHMHLNESTDNC